ncbi:MAG: hypothetical protein ACRYGP_23065 [Janthinobacterium lividum]
MLSDFPTPGLKRRPNRDGSERFVWVARADIVAAGYEPKKVRLHYAADDLALISAACQRLQAEMLAWSAGQRRDPLRFDGTLASLIRRYQNDPASPYHQIKWNTRRIYDQTLGVIEKAFGKRVLTSLGLTDFRRWYDEAKKPKAPGQPERINKAHKMVSLCRRLFTYGIAAEIPDCARLAAILDASRCKQPGRRRVKLERHHVEAFIVEALKNNRLSLALGTTLQFDTALRQRDVIGEWEPLPEGETAGGIVLHRRRWANGLTWADINDRFEIFKATTKTGAIAAHDLSLCPETMRLLQLVPAAKRIGPLIIDEEAGRPYATDGYAREWRAIADKAGIPKHVWNMDARAGAITEADDAGADLDEIRAVAAHSQASTTARYVRGSIGKSRNVAKLRAAQRIAKNVP